MALTFDDLKELKREDKCFIEIASDNEIINGILFDNLHLLLVGIDNRIIFNIIDNTVYKGYIEVKYDPTSTGFVLLAIEPFHQLMID